MNLLTISAALPVSSVGEQQHLWNELDPFDLSAFSSTPSWVSGTTDATTAITPISSLPTDTLPSCTQRDSSLPFSVDFVPDQMAVSTSSSATAPYLLDDRHTQTIPTLPMNTKINTSATDFDTTRLISEADDFVTSNLEFPVQTSPIPVEFTDPTCDVNTSNITDDDLTSQHDQPQLSVSSIQSSLLSSHFPLHSVNTSLLEQPSHHQQQQQQHNQDQQSCHAIAIPQSTTNIPIIPTEPQSHKLSPGTSSSSLRSISSQHITSSQEKKLQSTSPSSLAISQQPSSSIPITSTMNTSNNFARIAGPTIGRVQKQTRRYTAPKSSRYCHLCARHQRSVSMVPCGNVELGLCQKSVCKKCIDLYHLEVSGPFWACPHCQNKCPQRAKCFAYDRQTARRREKTLRAKLNSMSASASAATNTTAGVVTTTANAKQ